MNEKADQGIKLYNWFIDDIVNVVNNWPRTANFEMRFSSEPTVCSETGSCHANFWNSLTPEEKQHVIEIAKEEMIVGVATVLHTLSGFDLIKVDVRITHSPYGTSMDEEFYRRLEGFEWPEKK